ncbi:hypothetical protein HNR42_002791 [Deinobacterium chartae]|uniref:BREX system P-loop protein BrxC n=1 Tax=Deinobacterium chartae TaxID=521158 RepID=A0A841I4K7_9DEIO|nr:hypothetical protein [Deinobacterium chartae]
MNNADVFARNPLHTDIPNQGVSSLGTPRRPEEWRVLQWELESFVCEGEYARGLEKILSSYLQNVEAPEQPSVWVSGFYGSGKSHLVRVLEYLWRNPVFPSGTPAEGRQARDLVELPEDVRVHLRELSTKGKQAGGLWSAAGTLNSGVAEYARMAFLQIAFRAAGLPEALHQARLVLWLHDRGVLDATRQAVEAAGGDWGYELRNMFVSPILAQAVRAHALPGLGSDDAALEALRHQFPQVQDVTNEELVDTLTAVFRYVTDGSGKAPCTLFVLDELQQYIGESNERAMQVQELVETCSKRFQGKVLVIATGQSAMSATPQLARIRGRFPLSVELSDADVENVIRKVILRKNPAAVDVVRNTLDATSGEIDRHLAGSKFAARHEDKNVLVADYPLLPTRRRFWEKVLRAIDRGGSAGQLRSQLRITHEASKSVAARPVGHVVGADFIYDQQVAHMKQAGVLLPETDSMIARLNDGTPDGQLRQRLAQTIFLLGKLGTDEGVKADAATLADLIVEDLPAGSTALRARIPDLLADLVERGEVMQVADSYRLQTREGAEWTSAFNNAYGRIFNDSVRLAQERARLLREAVQATLKPVTAVQGESRTPRKIDLHLSDNAPDVASSAVPVWVRDEWSTTLETVRGEARAYGLEGAQGAVVHVHLPKLRDQDLRRALAAKLAATEVLNARANANTPEAREAQAAMKTRSDQADAEVRGIIADIVNGGRVFQGGGNEVGEGSLRASVQAAVTSALARLYPNFATADDPRWAQVFRNARNGSTSALEAIGHKSEPEQHPVSKAVLGIIGPGARGSDVRKALTAPPYGWPQDAIDGTLVLLMLTGHLKASVNGSPVDAKAIEASKINQIEFKPENIVITKLQRIAVRKLLTEADINVGSGLEGQGVARLLADLLEFHRQTGGEAPLPEPRDTAWLKHGASLQGNEQLLWAYQKREDLGAEWKRTRAQADLAKERLKDWSLLQKLLKHNANEDLAAQAEAIRNGRQLLDEVDPVRPLASALMKDLRARLTEALQAYTQRYEAALTELKGMPEWTKLEPADQDSVLRKANLQPASDSKLSSITEVVQELDRTPLSEWQARQEALVARLQRAKEEVLARARPKAKQLRPKTASLESPADVDRYLEELRSELLKLMESGDPVVII